MTKYEFQVEGSGEKTNIFIINICTSKRVAQHIETIEIAKLLVNLLNHNTYSGC